MTGKENLGREAWSQINTSFTKAEDKLYDVNPTANQIASARDGSLVDGALKIGEKIAGGIKTAVTRGAMARTYDFSPFGGNFDYASNQSNTGGYENIKYVNKYLDPKTKPAKQSWLQHVTDKIGRYVFGASVSEGEDEGIYASADLLENAGRYVKTKSKEYLSDFVNALITGGRKAKEGSVSHEGAHYELGIKNEDVAEEYGVRNVLELGKNDPVVGKALNRYWSTNDFLEVA